MADVPPPSYDGSRLLALYERAALILRNTEREADRFGAAARALCEFFHTLAADDAFWGVLGNVVDNKPDIHQLLGAAADFEDEEYALLVEAGVDEITAADLAGNLRRTIQQYQPDSVPATQGIRTGIHQMADAICDAQNELDERQRNHGARQQDRYARRRRRSRLKLLGRCLGVAATIVTIVVDIPVLPTPAGIGSVVGGVIQVGQQVSEFVADRENDG